MVVMLTRSGSHTMMEPNLCLPPSQKSVLVSIGPLFRAQSSELRVAGNSTQKLQKKRQTGEMVQCLRAHIALAEAWSSVDDSVRKVFTAYA